MMYICGVLKNKDMTTLDQNKQIFWKNQLVRFINWDSLTVGGNIKIKLRRALITVNISELHNK